MIAVKPAFGSFDQGMEALFVGFCLIVEAGEVSVTYFGDTKKDEKDVTDSFFPSYCSECTPTQYQ